MWSLDCDSGNKLAQAWNEKDVGGGDNGNGVYSGKKETSQHHIER